MLHRAAHSRSARKTVFVTTAGRIVLLKNGQFAQILLHRKTASLDLTPMPV
jgi:hypothetical protein